MRRGLIVSQFPVLPATQGNRVRLLASCQALRKAGFTLDFLYYPREDGSRVSARNLERLHSVFSLVFLVPGDDPWPGMTEKHQNARDICPPRIAAFYRTLARDIHYDFVYANYAPYAGVFGACDEDVVRVLDTHDRLGDRRDTLERVGLVPDFFSLSVAEEGALAAEADVVMAIKESEAAYFREISGRPVLSLGVPLEPVPTPDTSPADGHATRLTFGFIGSNNAVNRVAMRELLALLANEATFWRGRARLFIVGRVLEEVEIPAALADVVDSRLSVPELSDFYDQCDVVLVPTVSSSGLKIKTIEALSHGKPVIATADGFDGVPSAFAEHNCTSQAEVLALCRRIIQGEVTVSSLRQSSQQVAERYQRDHALSEAALIEALQPYRVAVLLADAAQDATLHAWLFGLLRFLTRRCEVDVLCPEGRTPSRAFLDLLRQHGREARVLVGPAPGSPPHDLLVHAAGPLGPEAPAAHLRLACGARSLRLSGAALSHGTDGPVEKVFESAWPLDLIDEPHWGTRRRLVVLACRAGARVAEELLKQWLDLPAFAHLRGEYTQERLVAVNPSEGLAAAARALGFGVLPLREHLFDQPWASRKDLVVIGVPDASEIAACTALMSVSSTRIFVSDESLLTLGKMICGPEVAVRRFGSGAQLCHLLARGLGNVQARQGALMRYQPNHGALTQVTAAIKRALIAERLAAAEAAATAPPEGPAAGPGLRP